MGQTLPNVGGQSVSALPRVSDVNLFRDRESVVDLYSQIPHCTFDLSMPQEKLDGSQVPGPAVDQGGLGSSERVGAEKSRVEPDARDPLGDEPSVLARRHASVDAPSARDQKIATLLAGHLQVLIDSLPGRFRQFEPNGLAGFPLAHSNPVDRVSTRCHVLNPQRDHVATAQLAVDGEIEHR